MDPVRNPFAPGAGSQPPELAGRDEIIYDVDIALQRVLHARHNKPLIFLGLRGTGKTVLLNKIEGMAEERHHLTSFIEAPNDLSLVVSLYPKIQQVLRKLSIIKAAKSAAYNALGVLQSFASVFSISVGDVSISVDPVIGTADSGVLEYDLSELFVSIGEAAQSAGTAWTLLIDELQYLSKEELSALIVAIHKVTQKKLPILFFGAGLPQIAALTGDAKSYSERLFSFPPIGPLDELAAMSAVEQPIINEGEIITKAAIKMIYEKTEGYPYFLQEWGFQAWSLADKSPINIIDVENATLEALRRLDDSFFRVRFERLTPKEREYVMAMASLGKGPYRSSEVADVLGVDMHKLGPRRANIIRKGMIFSGAHGDIDFTVPMFDGFLSRYT